MYPKVNLKQLINIRDEYHLLKSTWELCKDIRSCSNFSLSVITIFVKFLWLMKNSDPRIDLFEVNSQKHRRVENIII